MRRDEFAGNAMIDTDFTYQASLTAVHVATRPHVVGASAAAGISAETAQKVLHKNLAALCGLG